MSSTVIVREDSDMRTQSIIAGETCPLCGGYGVVIGRKDDVEIRECASGHDPIQLAWAWNSVEEYENFYADDCEYHEHEQKRGGQKGFFERDTACLNAAYQRLSLISLIIPPHTHPVLCDIGAGNGAFVAMAEAHGYDAFGLEPNPAMVAYAWSHGRRISEGHWGDTATFMPDVVTLCDVFEHLTQPMQCLEYLSSEVTNALFYIEMPEWDSEHQRSQGLNWRHVRSRQHIALYSRGAIEKMYEKAGFTVILFVRPLNGLLGKMAHILKVSDTKCLQQSNLSSDVD